MKKVTSILIGAGIRGGYVYSQYALDHPDEFQVVAVAEPDKERRELFAAKHHIPAELCFESYEELLKKGGFYATLYNSQFEDSVA